MREWNHEGDGVWTRPTEKISDGRGDEIWVTAIWTEEDGVQVSLQTPEDGLIPAAIVGKVAAAMIDMGFGAPAPTAEQHAKAA